MKQLLSLLLLAVGTLCFGAERRLAPVPVTGDINYFYLTDGTVVAFPDECIDPIEESDGSYTVVDLAGHSYTYAAADIDEVSFNAPSDLPSLSSFKIGAKQNYMLTMDATGTITADDSVLISVGGIGKRLVPNFSTSAQDDEVYVGLQLQTSKQTNQRFDEPVVYTVARPGWRMLRAYDDGSYRMTPFGRDYAVSATFLSDQPTTEYGIPVVDIRTDDGLIITSKEVYKTARISIDGAGYFPDMADTTVLIKGRGNTSWKGAAVDSVGNPTKNPKNPYRLKFDAKQTPLGLKSAKSWCLIAQSQKSSMFTNPIGQRIADLVGCAYPNHFIPVDLYINGDYRGQYCFTEKVGFAKNSIDLDDKTNAALLELDSYYDEDYKFRTTRYNLPVNIKEPDLADTTVTLTKQMIQTSFNRLTDACYVQGDLSEIVDIDKLVSYLMLTDLIYNQEFMHPKSTYCYIENVRDANSPIVFGPVWDLDWAFGYEVARTYYTVNTQNDFWTESTVRDVVGFISNLRYSGDNVNRAYYRLWTEWQDHLLDEILEYCDDYYAATANSFAHDKLKWAQGGAGTYQTLTTNCKTWLSQRTDFVYDYLSNTLGYANRDYLWPTEDAQVEITVPTAAPTGIYDMLGRRMSDDLNALPAGVYIINGKKKVICK